MAPPGPLDVPTASRRGIASALGVLRGIDGMAQAVTACNALLQYVTRGYGAFGGAHDDRNRRCRVLLRGRRPNVRRSDAPNTVAMAKGAKDSARSALSRWATCVQRARTSRNSEVR